MPRRYSKYLEMQTKEAGHTDSEDINSMDDRSASDLSFVTSDDDADVDNDMMAIYAQSLSSQASEYGFGTPLFKKRSKESGIGRGSIFDDILAKQHRKLSRRKIASPVVPLAPSMQTRTHSGIDIENSVQIAKSFCFDPVPAESLNASGKIASPVVPLAPSMQTRDPVPAESLNVSGGLGRGVGTNRLKLRRKIVHIEQ